MDDSTQCTLQMSKSEEAKPWGHGHGSIKCTAFAEVTNLVHVPNFGGLSGSEDRGGGDNSIQFINFGRVGDKSFKE